MSSQINQITQFLFESDNLENISLDQLRQLVDEFPSFNAGHYLLTQKLQDEESPELTTEVQKTVLYFHNPFWLQWLLDRAKADKRMEVPGQVSSESARQELPDVQEVVGISVEEEIAASDALLSSGRSLEQPDENTAEAFTITEIISRFENELKEELHFNRVQSAELEQVQNLEEPASPSEISSPVLEQKQEVPHFLRPDDPLNDLHAIHSQGNGEPYATVDLDGPMAEWQEKIADESHSKRISAIEQEPVKEIQEMGAGRHEVSDQSELNSSAEIQLDPPKQDRVIEEDQFFRKEDQKENLSVPDRKWDEPETNEQEPSESFGEIEEEEQKPEPKRAYFFWEKEFYGDQPGQGPQVEKVEAKKENQPLDPEHVEDHVTAQEPLQDFKKEQTDEVPLFFDAGLSAQQRDEPNVKAFVEAQDSQNTSEEIPSPLSSILQKEIQVAETPEAELSFQPYHTVYYFASQGIRFIQEENPTDTRETRASRPIESDETPSAVHVKLR
jgi:hypothetical protein